MTDEVQIRAADKNDIADIQRLARAIWPVTYGNILPAENLNYMLDYFYNAAALEKQMTVMNHRFIMSLLNQGPVGFASWSKVDDGGVYKLHKLYVDTQIQGKGIGKKLVEYIFQELRTANATALRVNVNRHNSAKDFYEKTGFTVMGEEDVDIGNGVFQNDYILEKKITYPS